MECGCKAVAVEPQRRWTVDEAREILGMLSWYSDLHYEYVCGTRLSLQPISAGRVMVVVAWECLRGWALEAARDRESRGVAARHSNLSLPSAFLPTIRTHPNPHPLRYPYRLRTPSPDYSASQSIIRAHLLSPGSRGSSRPCLGTP